MSVCVQYLLYDSVCEGAVYSTGGTLCAFVLLCFVWARKSQAEVDY